MSIVKKRFSLAKFEKDARTLAKKHGLKTIGYDDLRRLSFINSKKLPRVIILNGERQEWVGIGWITVHEQTPRRGNGGKTSHKRKHVRVWLDGQSMLTFTEDQQKTLQVWIRRYAKPPL